MTYIEVIKQLNLVFPSTVDVDYREVSSEEIWRNVYDFLQRIKLLDKFTDDELREIREYIVFEQKNNYHKKAIVKMNLKSDYDYGFDQNNYFFKQSVLRMKEFVLNTVIDKARLRYDLVTGEYDSYNRNIGAIKEINEYIDTQRVERYLSKLLTISKEDNDYYRIEMSLFVRDILFNYGLNPRSPELIKLSNAISNKIDEVIASTGSTIKEIDNNDDEKKKIVKEIAALLTATLRNCLQNRKKDEYTILPDEGSIARRVDKHFREKSIKDKEDDVDSLYKEYENQQKILDKNRKILEELKRLKEKERELKDELKENNLRLGGRK